MPDWQMTIEVKDLRLMQRKLEHIAVNLAKGGNVVAKAALVIERQIKQNATGRPGPNVQTGRLRASITTEMLGDLKAQVGTSVFYASFVEFGHKQEVGRFVPIYGMRRIGRGEFAGRYNVSGGLGLRLVNPTAPAYPFFFEALDQCKDKLTNVVVDYGKELGREWLGTEYLE